MFRLTLRSVAGKAKPSKVHSEQLHELKYVLEMLQALPAESALAVRGGLKSAERLGCKACQDFSPRGQFFGNHRIITDQPCQVTNGVLDDLFDVYNGWGGRGFPAGQRGSADTFYFQIGVLYGVRHNCHIGQDHALVLHSPGRRVYDARRETVYPECLHDRCRRLFLDAKANP